MSWQKLMFLVMQNHGKFNETALNNLLNQILVCVKIKYHFWASLI